MMGAGAPKRTSSEATHGEEAGAPRSPTAKRARVDGTARPEEHHLFVGYGLPHDSACGVRGEIGAALARYADTGRVHKLKRPNGMPCAFSHQAVLVRSMLAPRCKPFSGQPDHWAPGEAFDQVARELGFTREELEEACVHISGRGGPVLLHREPVPVVMPAPPCAAIAFPHRLRRTPPGPPPPVFRMPLVDGGAAAVQEDAGVVGSGSNPLYLPHLFQNLPRGVPHRMTATTVAK
jgi:hypothetical protein